MWILVISYHHLVINGQCTEEATKFAEAPGAPKVVQVKAGHEELRDVFNHPESCVERSPKLMQQLHVILFPEVGTAEGMERCRKRF